MTDLTIHLARHEGTARLTLAGDLDVGSVPRLRAALQEAVDDGPEVIELDLGGVDFVDSTGLGVLIGAHRRAGETGGRLVAVAVSPALQRVLELTGVSDLLTGS